MGTLKSKTAKEIAERHDRSPDDPRALFQLASKLKSKSRKHQRKADDRHARRVGYNDLQGEEKTDEELKGEESFHSEKASRLRRRAETLEERANELRDSLNQ